MSGACWGLATISSEFSSRRSCAADPPDWPKQCNVRSPSLRFDTRISAVIAFGASGAQFSQAAKSAMASFSGMFQVTPKVQTCQTGASRK